MSDDSYEEFLHFNSGRVVIQACVQCGAAVPPELSGAHVAWHKRTAGDDRMRASFPDELRQMADGKGVVPSGSFVPIARSLLREIADLLEGTR